MSSVNRPPRGLGRLSGTRLRAAIIAGCRRVLARREHLNRINVFPVPDGDTGTNLAFTLSAVLASARRVRDASIGGLLKRVSRDAVDGARGNSGAIFAQFFSGLAEALNRHHDADAEDLAKAAEAAARSARSCLDKPREGTILSVIGDFASEFRLQAERGVADLRTLFRYGLERARVSLANTPQQLPVLRAAGVVDAGAAGFVDFLEGVQDYLDNGRQALRLPQGLREATAAQDDVHLESVEADSHYRYCSECVVIGDDLDPAAVREKLSALPLDSLVVAGGRERLRVHAHIDTPNLLFEALKSFGEVSQRKADDMCAQARLRAAPFQPVRVVSDSAADFPAGECERLGIGLVPVRVAIGDEDFLDRVTLSANELYARQRVEAGRIRTSQPPLGDFRRAYELTLSHCDHVVALDLSSKLSGTYQASASAARDVNADRVEAIDTLNASCGHALIAMSAAEAAQAGASVKQVREVVKQAMADTQVYAVIADLRYAVAGGRIPAWLKRVADAFGLHVLITVRDGRIKPFGALRKGGRLMDRFSARLARRVRGANRYRAIVGHCDAPEAAAELAGALRERIAGLQTVHVTECGPALGCHAGAGTVVVGLQALRDDAKVSP